MLSPAIVRTSTALLVALPALFAWNHEAHGSAAVGIDPAGARAPLFADGSVGCSGADDLEQIVGVARLQPIDVGIRFQVVLLHGAPNWDYYVELSQDGVCAQPKKFHGLTTNASGFGILTGVYPAGPGTYEFLVDVVSDPSSQVPSNPKLREIAPAELLQIAVP